MSSIAFIAFTRRGCELARRVAAALDARPEYAGVRTGVCGPARLAQECGVAPYASLSAWTAEHFATDDALVFVGAAGIAVRAIAAHVRDKFTDPAVVSVDEAGLFVVPLLSGHVGGANGLARAIAESCGGQAVVSTATDVNGRFAVDEWAVRNDMAIVERALAKAVSARLLEGGNVGYWTDCWPEWELPEGVICPPERSAPSPCHPERSAPSPCPPERSAPSPCPPERSVPSPCHPERSAERGVEGPPPELGFAVSLDTTCAPFERTLHLVPRVVTVGVGCRKGVDSRTLADHVHESLQRANVSPLAVARLASIDVKKDESAILELARENGWELVFYTAEELAAVPGEFETSEFVKRTVGVDNVCERAALACGGVLLSGKHAQDGTTVALALRLSRGQAL